MRIISILLIFGATLLSINVVGLDNLGAWAFINSELESDPDIYVVEDCYNDMDDDGDGLIDYADTLDCFS